MTHRNDKTLAALFCTVSALSFGTFPSAEAAPLFPPPHTTTFVTAGPAVTAADAGVRIGPWYRPVLDAAARLRLDGLGGAAQVATSVTTTPWYRAAN